jgi:ubiquinone/menaquinone biosynthesis C-methylase UbiE
MKTLHSKAKKRKYNKGLSTFWHKRATHYDKLFWTKDKGYLEKIIRVAGFKKSDLVLDVGVGTGAVAKIVKPYVKHVIGVDISESMLMQRAWDGISTIKWDIRDALFAHGMFDKVVARMCFHHIVKNLDLAILRCYDLLKPGGKIIVAEGLPPCDDPEVITWYKKMFSYKEERLTFSEGGLKEKLLKIGFKNITIHWYAIHSFSIRNWIIHSGLSKKRQTILLDLHRTAFPKVKDAYNMRCTADDCIIDTRNVILAGTK